MLAFGRIINRVVSISKNKKSEGDSTVQSSKYLNQF
jgi:hypothetical protein